jgi:hypothetical protein
MKVRSAVLGGALVPRLRQTAGDGTRGEEQSEPDITRWIPIVVPLSALVIVAGVYFVAAEVLARIV